jgi:hypothetical protein
LALRLKMLSLQTSDPNIRNHTRTGDKRKENRLGIEHAWRRSEMHTAFGEEYLKAENHLEDLIADGGLLFKNLNYDGERVPDLSGSGQEQVASFVNTVMNQQVI